MLMNKLVSIVSRIAFAASLVLIVVSIIEKVATTTGYTILKGAYTPSRLLEIAAVFLILVIALLLRQVRDGLEKRNA